MIYYFLFFFLAGWFSAVIGFEVDPVLGNVAGFASFIVLFYFASRKGGGG